MARRPHGRRLQGGGAEGGLTATSPGRGPTAMTGAARMARTPAPRLFALGSPAPRPGFVLPVRPRAAFAPGHVLALLARARAPVRLCALGCPATGAGPSARQRLAPCPVLLGRPCPPARPDRRACRLADSAPPPGPSSLPAGGAGSRGRPRAGARARRWSPCRPGPPPIRRTARSGARARRPAPLRPRGRRAWRRRRSGR